MINRLALIFALCAVGTAQAAQLPETYLGSWSRNDMSDVEITGIAIGSRTYHEPGYNCDIRSVQKRDDIASPGSPVYLVEMRCAGEGENEPPPSRGQLVREVWALRKIENTQVLAIAATGGASFPSIHLLHRPKP